MSSVERATLAFDEDFQHRALILTAALAYRVLNIPKEDANNTATVEALSRLIAKAAEFLNNPDSFDKRLAISVAALLPETEVANPSDTAISQALLQVFEGIAGVGLHLGEPDWVADAGPVPEDVLPNEEASP